MVTFDLSRVTEVRHVRDPAPFVRVRIEGPSIAWPNDADWDPDDLHDRLLALDSHGSQQHDGGARPAERHRATVPEISGFFGIIIRMYYADHARPRFHADYGDASIAIEISGDEVCGAFPPARLPLLFEWRDRHRDELLDNWDRLREGRTPLPIAPLE